MRYQQRNQHGTPRHRRRADNGLDPQMQDLVPHWVEPYGRINYVENLLGGIAVLFIDWVGLHQPPGWLSNVAGAIVPLFTGTISFQ